MIVLGVFGLLSALCAAMAVWFFAQRASVHRVRRVGEAGPRRTSESVLSNNHIRWVGLSGGALLGWTFGGVIGLAVGALAGAWVMYQWLQRQSQPHLRHHNSLVRDTPVMLDLLCAALASGATVGESLRVVRDSMPDSPVAEILTQVSDSMEWGADPREAWAPWIHHPVLGRLAQSVTRSQDSGAGLIAVLESAADQLRQEHKRQVESAARSAGVSAVLPLAACFLPAFFALGVVPIVASLATSTDFMGW